MATRKKKTINEEIKVEENIVETPVVEEEKPAKKSPRKKHVVISNPRVNIRKHPSLMAAVLFIASEGDKFELVQAETENGFYVIKCDNGIAYVASDFATLA